MNAANERAKNLVVKTRERQNPVHLLDLHGLHVDEALGTLKERLDSFDRKPLILKMCVDAEVNRSV
jgi:hypothetical protein